MHRIDAPGYAVGNTFTDGNPSTGTPATIVDAAWLNDVQENVAQVIEASGLTLSKGDYTQLLKAIVTKGLQGNYFNVASAAGTADAITATFTPVVTALANGMTLYVRAAAANATTAPTFTPNSGTIVAKAVVKGAGIALAAGDIHGTGHWIELQYDSTLDKWVMKNPATGVVAAAGAKTGEYFWWPVGSTPSHGLLCNGAAVSRTTYAALFAILSTTFGAGDGSTTFNLPNVPAGYTLTNKTGSEGTTSIGQGIAHTHSAAAAGVQQLVAAGGIGVVGFAGGATSVGGTINEAASMYARLCIRF